MGPGLMHSASIQSGSIPIGGVASLLRGAAGRSLEWQLHWLLTFGVFLEFVGHGACGIATKAGWLPFFRVFHIPDAVAFNLMPLVGWVDVVLGLLAVFSPRRAVFLHMAVWGCFTALLRPASGQGWWEFIERAYNYGVPFALLFLHGPGWDRASWLAPLRSVPGAFPHDSRRLLWILRGITALMLVGHGGFGPFMAKANLLTHYGSVGLDGVGLTLETVRTGVGFIEIGLGLLALFARRPAFFLLVCGWKLATDSLHWTAGIQLACWEIVERGGSYVAPLAAAILLREPDRPTEARRD